MKKRMIYRLAVVLAIAIIIGTSSVYVIGQKGKIQGEEKKFLAEENREEVVTTIESAKSEATIKALTVNPESWDTSRVTAVTSEDNIVVPVPVGFTASPAENERYVNGNVTKKGNVSNLTFTSSGDYPWTQNESNIWVSGNKQVANSTSELISNPITVGANGGWVQVEWSVCSQSGYDVLYMYINDTVNGTSEQLPKEITGTPYGTAESSLIYTKCGKELVAGTYTISIKYTKYNNATHTGLDSGYVKSGTFINYDENGADELEIHKPGGFVIYEGTDPINDLWTASKERNQYVWVPVNDSSRIYETNSTSNKIKAKLWTTTASDRNPYTSYQSNADTKAEAGVLSSQDYDNIRYFSASKVGSYYGMGMPGYSKDTFYKELEIEYKNTINSIEKYGGFYIGRYETGAISSNTPVVRRMNTTLDSQTWYTMYPKMRNMSENNNIQTSMIWGSLFDETLEWIIGTGDKARVELSTDSTSWGNYNNSTFKYYNSAGALTNTRNRNAYTIIPSGSTERNSANNIYDLCGNVMDWTLEGNGSNFRYYRGGNYLSYGYNHPAHYRYNYNPYYSSNGVGFRSYLYVK